MAKKNRRELEDLVCRTVEPLLGREGYELVSVEIEGSGASTVVRLFIDKPGGVTLDDCVDVSGAVSTLLDVEDPIESAYNLEVSSPGVERPLRKAADFERFVGRSVMVKAFGPVPGAGPRKVFIGILRGLVDGQVQVDVDGTLFSVPQDLIAKAHLRWEPPPDTRGKPGHRPKKQKSAQADEAPVEASDETEDDDVEDDDLPLLDADGDAGDDEAWDDESEAT